MTSNSSHTVFIISDSARFAIRRKPGGWLRGGEGAWKSTASLIMRGAFLSIKNGATIFRRLLRIPKYCGTPVTMLHIGIFLNAESDVRTVIGRPMGFLCDSFISAVIA